MKWTTIWVGLLLISSFIQLSLGSTSFLQNPQIIPSSGVITSERTISPTPTSALTSYCSIGDSNVDSDSEARRVARYDLIVFLGDWNLARIVKQEDPSTIVLAYYNLAWATTWQTDPITGRKVIDIARENGWLLLTEWGEEIGRGQDLGLMDLRNSECRSFLADLIKYRIDNYSLDGVFADNCSPNAWYWQSTPINPRTGNLYTYDEYADDLIGCIRMIKSRIGNKILVGNGAAGGAGCGETGYWNSEWRPRYDKVFAEVDGCFIEGMLRWDNQPLRSEAEWVQDVNHLKHITSVAPDKIVIAGFIVANPPVGTSIEQLGKYALSMYYFGRYSSNTYFAANKFVDSSDYWLRGLGSPLEDYHKRTDVPIYERDYSKGLVLANPTPNDHTITIDGTQITIKAHSGIIIPK